MNPVTSFNALELSAFARALGWVQVEEALQDGLYTFNHPDFAPRQLIFAADEEFDDYSELLWDAALRLAELYNWSALDAVRRIEESNSDIVVSRVPLVERQSSTIALDYALQVLHSQKELLAAGAAANRERRPYYTRQFDTTKQLLDAARFRHTEVGSFVFKTSCSIYALDEPVEKTVEDEQLSIFSEDEIPSPLIPLTFVRRAMINIETGLQDLLLSIQTGKEQQLVEDIKGSAISPVSSNFCEAVADLRDREHPRAVDLSIAWSPLLPPTPGVLHKTIHIVPDYFPVIEQIGKALQPEKTDLRNTFLGTVEELRGDFNDLGQREGKVVLLLLREKNKAIKVRATLDAEQYDEAVAIHKNSTVVARVTGTIKLRSRQPHNFDLESFKIINV